jgi:hypothetical protein
MVLLKYLLVLAIELRRFLFPFFSESGALGGSTTGYSMPPSSVCFGYKYSLVSIFPDQKLTVFTGALMTDLTETSPSLARDYPELTRIML